MGETVPPELLEDTPLLELEMPPLLDPPLLPELEEIAPLLDEPPLEVASTPLLDDPPLPLPLLLEAVPLLDAPPLPLPLLAAPSSPLSSDASSPEPGMSGSSPSSGVRAPQATTTRSTAGGAKRARCARR